MFPPVPVDREGVCILYSDVFIEDSFPGRTALNLMVKKFT